MYANPLNVYHKTAKNTMSGRELEADALTGAAMKLRKVQADWDLECDDGYTALAGAVQHNQRLWSIFQADLAKKENALPVKLREQLLSISLYIDRQSIDILAYPAPDKITSLIDINLAIAAGLRGVSGRPA